MPRPPNTHDWMVLFALTIFWGTAFLFNELALRTFPPTVLVAVRTGTAALILVLAVHFSGLRLPTPNRRWGPIAVVAVLGTLAPFNLIAWAQQHISSSLTAVLMAIMPLFVITLSHFFVPGQRLNAYRVVGFAVGFAGVVLVIGPDLTGLGASNTVIWGMLAALAAALSYAAGSVFARRIEGDDPLILAAGTLLISATFSSALALPDLGRIQWPVAVEAAVAVIVLGVIATGLSTVLFFRLIQGPGPAFLSIVNYLVPAWAVLVGVVVLSESLTSAMLGGLAFILAGIAISEAGERLARMFSFRGAPRGLARALARRNSEACKRAGPAV